MQNNPLTQFKYTITKNSHITFENMPIDCKVQVISNSNIGKGTSISNPPITLSTGLYINKQELTLFIKQTTDLTKCPKNDTSSEPGKEKICYYLDVD